MSASKTMEVLEEVVEVVDETLDTLERIPKADLNGTTKPQQILILAFTASVSLAAGGFFGYKYAQKKLKAHYEGISEQEIAEAKAYFAGNKEGIFTDPQTAAAALIPSDEREERSPIREVVADAAQARGEYMPEGSAIPQSEKDRLLASESLRVPYHEMYKGDISLEQADQVIEKDPDADPQEVIGRVRFPESPAEAENFDMEKEAPLRSADEPYVITHDEFFGNDREFEQVSVTWYAGDSVLADNNDEDIRDADGMVGLKNMARFGHGSKDEKIVFVRNEKYSIDFEVALSEGTYTKEVMGLDPPG